MMADPLRRGVCIYGERTATAFDGTIIGGAELQMMLLARGLASQGVQVTLIDPTAEADRTTSEGVTIRTVPSWNKGKRGIRMFTRRIPEVLRLFKESRAGVYYVRGYSFLFAFILLLARLQNAVFVLGIASDLDLLGIRYRYRSFYHRNATLWDWFSSILPNHLAFGFIKTFADIVIVQHPGQLPLVNRKAVTLGNIVGNEVFDVPHREERRNFLVVGTISAQKGLRDAVSEFATLEECTFECIGGPDGRDGEHISETIRALPNVIMRGPLSREQTLEALAGAEALLNVSPREGFPNTFLEAWAVGTPVVSLAVDPGGIIRAHNLGVVCGGDWGTLKRVLAEGSFRRSPEGLKAYVRQHHSMEHACRAFHEAVLSFVH